jgi:phage anti-repressor protein
MMDEVEIIPIERGKFGLGVSSILLHRKLGIRTRHNDWIERRLAEYGFREGVDFYSNLSKSTGGRQPVEYILTLDVAKEFAIMENTEAGRAIRWYFIEIEKRYRDWVGFILPKLEIERDLFAERTGYKYIDLLMSCGGSVMSGSVRGRIRRNPREFWKNQAGEYVVTEVYARAIITNVMARQRNSEITERRLLIKN